MMSLWFHCGRVPAPAFDGFAVALDFGFWFETVPGKDGGQERVGDLPDANGLELGLGEAEKFTELAAAGLGAATARRSRRGPSGRARPMMPVGESNRTYRVPNNWEAGSGLVWPSTVIFGRCGCTG